MKIELKQLPELRATNGRKVETGLPIEALSSSGRAMVQTGLNVGDTLEFPSEPVIASQEVRPNGPKAYVLGVKRNDTFGWASIGSLRRTDANMKPVGPVAIELNSDKFENDVDRVKFLAGKKIEVYATETVTVAKFDEAGARLKETDEKEIPVCRFI